MKTQQVATIALLMLSCACALASPTEAARVHRQTNYRTASDQGRTRIPTGTAMNVRLDSKISTEDARRGQPWTGTVTQSVMVGNQVVIPAGSAVQGVVRRSIQGTHSTRAQIALSVRQVTTNGRSMNVNAETPPIIADSHRAKKLGAIAGGAAVGALLGHTVAKDNHGTLIGGVVGGAAGYGLTRNAMRTMQLKPGTEIMFTTSGDVLAYR